MPSPSAVLSGRRTKAISRPLALALLLSAAHAKVDWDRPVEPLAAAIAQPSPTRPPDIVWIVVDDLGWRDLGCYGHATHRTPHIDRMAREGLRFTQAYANAPNCAPSRASFVTGQLPPRHGIYTVGQSTRGRSANRKLIPTRNRTVLEDSAVTIAEWLAPRGYRSAMIGKWHLGDDPRTQGFDVAVAGNQAGHPKSYFSPYHNPSLEDGPEGEYLTDRMTDEALAFLAEERDEPRFLLLSFFAVHTPVQGKAELRENYEAAALAAGIEEAAARRAGHYGAMVETVDANVGRLLDAIRASQRDTFVLLFSDNGGHARYTTMEPLRGSKGQLYEGGIREPLIFHRPGHVPAGAVCDEPVTAVDFLPTSLALAGIEAPTDASLDGTDLGPLLAGGTLGERALFWYFPAYLEAYTQAQGSWRTTPASAIRVGDWKLVHFFEDQRDELYDLRADVAESVDLSATRAPDAQRLTSALDAWRRRMGVAAAFEPNPEYEGSR